MCGRVAEWPNASVLKTEVPRGTGGSNPSSSDLITSAKAKGRFLRLTIAETAIIARVKEERTFVFDSSIQKVLISGRSAFFQSNQMILGRGNCM